MKTAPKSFGSVLTGFIASSVVMMILEFLNGHVFYPALGKAAEGVTDQAVVRHLMATAPKGALLVVLFGWALGGLVGGLIAGLLLTGPMALVGARLAVRS